MEALRAKNREHSELHHDVSEQVKDIRRQLTNQSRGGGRVEHKGTHRIGRRTVDHFALSPSAADEYLGSGVGAVAIPEGGRRGRGMMLTQRSNEHPGMEIHERAHLTPKRSAYRSRNMNPKAAAGEEARADMAVGHPNEYYRSRPKDTAEHEAHGRAPSANSGYAQAARNPSAQSIHAMNANSNARGIFNLTAMPRYRKVQDKIANAEGRKRRLIQPHRHDQASVIGGAAAVSTGAVLYNRHQKERADQAYQRLVDELDTSMSNHEARRLTGRYDTRGPLPKGLSREERMRAYEARYIAAGGKKGEKWHRHAQAAEAGRNIGLAGATLGSAGLLAARTKSGRKLIAALPKVGHRINPTKLRHGSENVALGAGAFGGASEFYGEVARRRRASYHHSPAGVAGSALARMRDYTPTKPGGRR